MRKRTFLILVLLVSWGTISTAKAVTPISYYIDLVAGEGDRGYRDGLFTSSLFSNPIGAAFSQDKTKVYITDALNNRVRIVDLSHQNNVSTLAGKNEKGKQDGSFEKATFNYPSLIVALPNNQLIVYDSGNALLRLIDLPQKQITTLVKSDSSNTPSINLGGIHSMIFDPKTNALYFTQPSLQTLKKLDMATRSVSTVLEKQPELPAPAAVCLFEDHICVADQSLSFVYRLEPTNSSSPVSLIQIGKGENIMALAASDGILYALQAGDHPWARITAKNGFIAGPITLMSSWGAPLEEKSPELNSLFNFTPEFRPTLLAFPDEPRKFLWVSPNTNAIYALRDDAYFEYKNGKKEESPAFLNGLTDFAYPVEKPPQTYRILILGDSHVFYGAENEYKRWPWGFNRWETFPKRLEAELNIEASLDNVPIHYEVLTLAQYRWENPLSVWPYYMAPYVIEKFNVDAVFLLQPGDLDLSAWFSRPYTKDNLPVLIQDKEYLLKPMSEKLSGHNLEKDLYNRCLQQKWVKKTDFEGLKTLATDPSILEDITQMVTLPYKLFNEKMKTLRNSQGNTIPYRVLFVPMGSVGAAIPIEVYRNFYKEICKRSEVDLEDLTDPWTAMKISLYPTSEFVYMLHFDHNGNSALAYLVAHEMIKKQWIPFEQPTQKESGLNAASKSN